ncbi:hypothetical protein J8273_4834 [Carpediemonas membranifera]|uniref:TPX2 C-terminal domain-containing protein n=1 Tax=Carpediemonas membranifera TaxID=201153 RepID=A0A8J6E9R7_9EUKA|nr:hypothetical protein J8273_4834 [Carpediemonas membranifera]|eukprot:KAG9393715.1 hypothetical protein J8273_4834 [Carpediemonas membranifera]
MAQSSGPENTTQFKARSVPKSVYSGAKLPEVEAKPITIPETPQFASKNRADSRPAYVEEEVAPFKARPVPKEVYLGSLMAVVEPKPITVPETPKCFAGGLERTIYEPEPEPEYKFKARDMPREIYEHPGKHGVPTIPRKDATIPMTPNFPTEARRLAWEQKKAEQERKEQEEAARRAEEEALKAVAEKEELSKLRETLVHKARPVPKFYHRE